MASVMVKVVKFTPSREGNATRALRAAGVLRRVMRDIRPPGDVRQSKGRIAA
jgi:hypothetical protein